MQVQLTLDTREVAEIIAALRFHKAIYSVAANNEPPVLLCEKWDRVETIIQKLTTQSHDTTNHFGAGGEAASI